MRSSIQAASERAPGTIDWLVAQIVAPIALVERSGRLAHCNQAFERLLAEETERGRRRIRATLRSLAAAMAARRLTSRSPGTPGNAAVATSYRRYVLEPEYAPPNGAFAGLIRIRRSREPLEADALMRRFGLTAREAQVARLLAAGASNKSIAFELSLSEHTSRRHTENVFRKMDVSSRAALVARFYATS